MMADQSPQEPAGEQTAAQEAVVPEPATEQPSGPAVAPPAEESFLGDPDGQQSSVPTPPPPREDPPIGGSSPAEADRIAADQHDAFAEKPHLYAAGAFVGAFAFAQILKAIFGSDD